MLVYLVDLCLYCYCCVRGMGLWCAQSAQVVHKQKPALYTLQAFGDLSTTAFQAESNTSCNLIVSKDYGTWFSSWRKVFSSSGKRSNLDLSQHLSLHCKRVGLPSGKSKVSFSNLPFKPCSSVGIRGSKADLTHAVHTLTVCWGVLPC